MLCLAPILVTLCGLSGGTALEPNPHLREVFVRQDGPDTGEYIHFSQVYPGTRGPAVAVVDGDGVLVGLWDFSGTTTTDWEVIIGGPAVANRTFDLSAGVGPAVSGPDDFLPDGTQTLYWLPHPASELPYVHGLVGTNVDPDGDGRTLLFDPVMVSVEPRTRVALVDDRWPTQGRVFDCAPIVGPDGMDAPAGVSLSPVGYGCGGVCRDAWLLPDGTSSGSCGFTGSRGLVECDQRLLGTPFCEGSSAGFASRTVAWGSPLLADGELSLAHGIQLGSRRVHLVSLGRSSGALPGTPEPLCLAAPWFRVPGTYVDFGSFACQGDRFDVDLGLLGTYLPVVAGVPLCFQSWTSTGTGSRQLSQPVAVILR